MFARLRLHAIIQTVQNIAKRRAMHQQLPRENNPKRSLSNRFGLPLKLVAMNLALAVVARNLKIATVTDLNSQIKF